MNISNRSRRQLVRGGKKRCLELEGAYPHPLQLYKAPPDFQLSFAEFEEATAERLAVLQTIDEINGKGLKSEDEWKKAIIAELREQDLKPFCKLIACKDSGDPEVELGMRRRDHVSHYVLRLAYCDTEDKRRWFIGRELELFRLRWLYLSSSMKKSFLQLNRINYELLSEEEKLIECETSSGLVNVGREYFKIPFKMVSDLVRTRRVHLRRGIAYVLDEDIISVLLANFRTQLSHSLAYASRNIHLLDEDDRVFTILRGAGQMQRLVTYSMEDNKEKIDIRNLDPLSDMSYPLCMQQLHQRLRTDNHLKHSARRQYCLFLKGIGVAMDDTIRFWKHEFMKKTDPETFDKKYLYFIRHTYGKEGKRANYKPMNCLQIINQGVGPGEYHGCPFRHGDPNMVKKMLTNNGLSVIGTQEVIDQMKKGHYQLACTKYFQLKHATNEDIPGINHPNYYFDSSRNIIAGKVVKKEDPGGPRSAKKTNNARTEAQTKQNPPPVWDDDSGYDFSAIQDV